MNISLTPELAKLVEKEVESGLYQTSSEVVRAGLRRLKEDRAARLPQAPTTLEELEKQSLESIDRLDRGEGVFRRVRKLASITAHGALKRYLAKEDDPMCE